MVKGTITITYGENVENHVGNQQIGAEIQNGISSKRLKEIYNEMVGKGYSCEFINITSLLDAKTRNSTNEPIAAHILIVRDFVNTYFKEDIDKKLYTKLSKLNWDTHARMYGRVVNKHARYNLCFADFAQEPNYEIGNGRVYDFNSCGIPELAKIRKFFEKLLCDGTSLNAEGNYYYDSTKCYIGYHGDTERKIVAGVRFGESFSLSYQWYHCSESISEPLTLQLQSGDMYIMSEKATGNDWKNRSKLTLRHAASPCE